MFRRTAEDLGLVQVLEEVARRALSIQGAAYVKNAKPLFDYKAYELRQSQVASVSFAREMALGDNVQAEYFPDISLIFDILNKEPTANFDGEIIYKTGEFIEAAERLSLIFSYADSRYNGDCEAKVQEILGDVPAELSSLKKEIFSILESPGKVKESYPSVKALIDKADETRLRRTKTAGNLMHQNSTIMHSDSAVLRDGRLVLPVKNEARNSLQGYIQSSSQSGETVFMEPFELIDMNNAVVLAQQEILIEIARLLAHLSEMIRNLELLLRDLVRKVSEADFLWAFSVWSTDRKCCRNISSDLYSVNLIKARHPLLGDSCVPIDLKIEKDIKALVLTGPNAGGKTVTMKTVGLFSLLNQICGFYPCDDGSSISLFDRVFTDIGDDQSIQNRLSTFSGHMKSIGFVLRNITKDSLVILDELGSGTDPQEGACLARSVLEYCSERSMLTLTTSHHGVLKQYAYSNKGVKNASMEFDEKTMAPTFRVISGLPGESHAIDTAKRMGLPKQVTAGALRYMSGEAVKISSIIRGLEIKRKEVQDKLDDIDKRLAEIKNRENRLKNEQHRVAAYENKLKKYMLSDFDEYLDRSRKELENTVRELREGELTKEKISKSRQLISNAEEKRNKLSSEIESTEAMLFENELEEMRSSSSNVELKPGMDVYCGKNKREGTIIRKEKDGMWQVAIGPIKFTFKETELTVPAVSSKKTVNYSFDKSSSAPKPKLNLDLRGYRLEEAIEALEDEIEACCVHGLTSFSVIHGYGDGILSAGIHNYLKMKENVADYRFAIPEDGGQGKTYIKLK